MSFRELKTYQRARSEARRVFKITVRFPAEERYSLVDQIRRSSRAVTAMIGEAWARRRYEGVLPSILFRLAAAHRRCDDAWQHIGAMLGSMNTPAGKFCGKE